MVPYSKAIFGPEVFGLLYTMLGAGIGVLLIACVNVSNLLVARASLRRRGRSWYLRCPPCGDERGLSPYDPR